MNLSPITMPEPEERLHKKIVRLFNLSDFIFSFFFGLLPSLLDITTDFSFADRFSHQRKHIMIDHN